ncbi:MAG: polysaccharide deacetylase family protein [Deltaproteobacteria bacterium]|nr:polysaccharide deacetylase family protein [Deltaproteobacteria bacterium]
MTRILGLKIDVDTYQGMKRGVPRLLSLLEREGIKATFFLSIGPDASGRAILQILKNPRFLKKMVRTRAASLYGFRTALYGTLLPSPKIGLSFPDLVRQIMAEGHEVQFHAWDHRRWQDELAVHTEAWIREWFRRGIDGFESLTGRRPSSFGAPAWLIDDRVLFVVRDLHLDYLSCTRAKEPFIHEGTDLIEIPSDLPCFEETGVEEGERKILAGLAQGGIHVLPVHAEVEGGRMSENFVRIIHASKKLDYCLLPLCDIRPLLDRENLITRRFRLQLLSGRSVPCAV